MITPHTLRSLIMTALIVAFTVSTLLGAWPTASDAMLIPTDSGITQGQPSAERLEDLQTIQNALETKVVRQRLEDLGFTSDEITAKLNGVPDEQLHAAATQIESVLVGGNGDYGYWPFSLLVLIVVVVLLVLLL
jgi:hypothetical protein